ncbi:MAG: DUF721 domain-containing protein [Deltaproteobacteria bacterium]|nr:DUF721 domain-containing protein [Deltaproteobacteria bacterium]
MSRRSSSPVELGATLASLSLTLPPDVERPPVPFLHWERAVGTRIARRARPHRLERGVLHVKVSSGVWASELQLLSDDILAQLRASGIEVQGLRFSVGKVERLGPPPPPPREAPRPLPLPDDIAAKVRTIEDDALRDAVGRAASLGLGADAVRRAELNRRAGRAGAESAAPGEDGREARRSSGPRRPDRS